MAAGIDVSVIELNCDGNDVHKTWGWQKGLGAWATSEERNYPGLLCKRLALQVAMQVKKKRKMHNLDSVQEKLSVHKQPRRGSVETVPEFRTSGNLLHDGRAIIGSPAVEELDPAKTRWSPEEFIEEAKKVAHPFDGPVKLAPNTASAIHFMSQVGPTALEHHRRDGIEWYEKRKLELGPSERELHSNLPADVERVVADKNILLFKEMLEDIGFDDMPVVYLLTIGTKIVGLLKKTGIWKPMDQSPMCSPGAVLAGAECAKSKLRSKTVISLPAKTNNC